MSVRDFDKVLNIKNSSTGEIFEVINFDDENFYSFESSTIFLRTTIGDVRLLRAIHDCIDNEHSCYISIGYKNN